MCDEYIPEHNKWVGCDYCDKWMCKNCAGLDTDDLMNNAKVVNGSALYAEKKIVMCISLQ